MKSIPEFRAQPRLCRLFLNCNSSAVLQTQLAPQSGRRFRTVQAVEMQPVHTTFQKPAAKVQYDIMSESTQRLKIIAKLFQTPPYPQRDFCTTHLGKTCQLRAVCNRHDAGDDRYLHTSFPDIGNKAEIGIWIIEILGNGNIRPSFHLADKIGNVL